MTCCPDPVQKHEVGTFLKANKNRIVFIGRAKNHLQQCPFHMLVTTVLFDQHMRVKTVLFDQVIERAPDELLLEVISAVSISCAILALIRSACKALPENVLRLFCKFRRYIFPNVSASAKVSASAYLFFFILLFLASPRKNENPDQLRCAFLASRRLSYV